MSINKEEGALILEVVRGERSCNDLHSIGIRIHRQEDKWIVENPRRITANAQAFDIALGILKHKDNPSILRCWADFVLMGASLIDLEIENDLLGKCLLEALWDICFEGIVHETAVKAAEKLVAEEGKK